MNKKGIITVSCLLIVLLLAAGCQSPAATDTTESNESASTNESSNGNEEKVLSLLIPNFYNDVEKNLWDKVVEGFEEMNPGIKVDLQTDDVRIESGKLTTMLNSGQTPPDAILMNAGPARVGVLSNAGLIQPLDDLYEKNNWKEELRPFAYNLAASGENIFELPHMIDAIAVFYNKDIFDEYGLTVPKTKEEFLNVMDVLRENDVEPLSVGARSPYSIGWIFGNILEATAGSEKVKNVLNGDGKWNDPEFVEAAEIMVDWVEKNYFIKDSITVTEEDSKYLFLNNKVAMYVGGTYFISEAAEHDLMDSTGFFTMPSLSGEKETFPTGGIGQTWVVPSNVENLDLAELWLDYILSKEHNEIILSAEEYNFIPAASISSSIEPAGSILKQAMNEIKNGSGYNPSVFNGTRTNEVYYQNLQGLVAGTISPQEAMDKIEEAAQKDREEGFSINIE